MFVTRNAEKYILILLNQFSVLPIDSYRLVRYKSIIRIRLFLTACNIIIERKNQIIVKYFLILRNL